ncbi:MAG: hypothetical protein Q4G19_01480 [Clostridia bacterium]|nr:hypothetical protein [Clostridia bacterium]
MDIKIGLKEICSFLPLLHNVASIKKEDRNGLLYSMDYTGDYYRLLPVLDGIFDAGCTVFAHKTPAGEMLLGRNYDLRHIYHDPETGTEEMTGLITVLRSQGGKAGYASIGICDAVWLDPNCRIFRRGSFDHKDKNTLRALMLPFLTMDGVNEKGLAVSILHLTTDNSFEETDYTDPATLSEKEKKDLVLLNAPGEVPDKMNGRLTKRSIIINPCDRRTWKVIKGQSARQTEPGKRSVPHTVLMRMMLDSCANCAEAVALARTVNIRSLPESDYHIMVTDPDRSVILEWIGSRLTVEECFHAANFYNNRADHFGYGYDRDDILKTAIDKNPDGISEEDCMKALEKASQNCLAGKDLGFTQWSAVYNLNRQSIRLALHTDYKQLYTFSLK